MAIARSMPCTWTKRLSQSRKRSITEGLMVRVSGATMPHPVGMTLDHTRVRDRCRHGHSDPTVARRAPAYAYLGLADVREHLPRARRAAQRDLGHHRALQAELLRRERARLVLTEHVG